MRCICGPEKSRKRLAYITKNGCVSTWIFARNIMHAIPERKVASFSEKAARNEAGRMATATGSGAVSLYYDLLQARGDTNVTPPRPN
jgi:hypothetical protein